MLIKQKNIILSLDDFGISQKANENMLQLLETGKIDRISIMPHGRIAIREIEKILASNVKLDIHIDLRNDIDPNRKIKDGVFKRVISFGFNYCSGRTNPASMQKQWEGQIEHFRELFGKSPDGISSHQHVHFFPPYFKIVIVLSKKYGINYLRLGTESYPLRSLVCFILNSFRRSNRKLFLASKLASSDLMISFDWLENFNKIFKLPLNKESEVIFHPERDEEMEFLERFIKQ